MALPTVETTYRKMTGQDDKFGEPHIDLKHASTCLEDQESISTIVEGLIYSGGVYVLAGEAGDGKTSLNIDMGFRVAGGQPFLGRPTCKTKVLFIDQDMGSTWLKLRIASIIRGEKIELTDVPFYYLSMPGLNLQDKNHAKILQILIEENHFGLVFLDALVDFLGDADENSSTEMNPIFANLRDIATVTNAAFWIAHHFNRAGAYRGSSAIKGKVDGLFQMTRETDSNNFTIKPEKVRYGKSQKIAGVMHWQDDLCWITSAYLSPETEKPRPKREKYVLSYLRTNGPSRMPDITGSADICSSRSALAAIYDLVGLGEIYRTNPEDKGRGSVAIYAIKKEKEVEIPF